MHSLAAESEIFRRGTANEGADEEEEDYAEYQRRMRLAAKQRTQQSKARAPKPTSATSASPVSGNVQTVLEKEHDDRVLARQRLEQREQRIDTTLNQCVGGQSSSGSSEPISAEELRTTLQKQTVEHAAETTQFVQSWIGP